MSLFLITKKNINLIIVEYLSLCEVKLIPNARFRLPEKSQETASNLNFINDHISFIMREGA
jgi:hypothetical protein